MESDGQLRGSIGAVAGAPRRPGSAGTWRRAVFGGASRRPGRREDLPGSLHKAFMMTQLDQM